MELSLTRAPLRRRPNAEPNDGFPPIADVRHEQQRISGACADPGGNTRDSEARGITAHRRPLPKTVRYALLTL
jgi:hypothetical protein